jgi:hypothetical protein
MKVDLHKQPGGSLEILVTLSRRNLEELLRQLQMPNSDRTITKIMPSKVLTVISEENITHYGPERERIRT